MYYVALDIGCIECGEDSHILGIFQEKAQAVLTCQIHRDKQRKDWTGEHSFFVYTIEELNKEYPIDYVDDE